METNNTQPSKGALWTGRIITILVVLFLLVDALMKIFKATPSMEGSVALGWPENLVQAIGVLLLVCTILYVIPRTAVIGALLLTAFLGGAVSIMLRAGVPFFFPIFMCALAWIGLALREPKVRSYLLT